MTQTMTRDRSLCFDKLSNRSKGEPEGDHA